MTATVIRGDARHLPLPDASVDLVVTSPPYFGLRSYTDGGEHYDGQIGSEPTPAEWVAALLDCTREWCRVLKPAGSIWVNLGDKYSSGNGGESGLTALGQRLGTGGGQKADIAKQRQARPPGTRPKSLLGLPWRYALGCIDDLGLILRAEVIWSKPNGLPESVTDRVRRSHEQWFHMVRMPRYYSAVDEIREPHAPQSIARTGRRYDAGDLFSVGTPNTLDPAQFCNPLGKLPGSVWTIPSQPLTVPASLGVDHFAAFPMEWPRRIIAGWSPPGICTVCGEGRRPVVDKQLVGVWHDKPAQNSRHIGTRGEHQNNLYGVKNTFGSTAATITAYTCACPGVCRPEHESCAESRENCTICDPAPTRPAVVLDPFGGTGTTALLADVLGRHGISIDRSADYCRLAAWRTTNPAQRATAMQVEKPAPVPEGQAELAFGT